jgi:DNA topoisomerase-1
VRLPQSWQNLNDSERRERQRRAKIIEVVQRSPEALADGVASARIAGLRYVDCRQLAGIRRVGAKDRFRYLGPEGRRASREDLARIKSLVIPPAWTDVWICPYPNGHLQATGRDARGRLQYRYHVRWRAVRDEVKYGRMLAFGEALPAIRRRVADDVARPGLPKEKVLAAVVQLLERTLIRVGNEEYARANGSIGLTTMRDSHARVTAGGLRFVFRGKSGVSHEIGLGDRRLARIVRACRDLPGQELFQYIDESGQRRPINSADVNTYLHDISAQDFTAKDFRTWHGTVLAARALADARPMRSEAHGKREIAAAVASVAARLGNTQSVCRKCYVHPAVVEAYRGGVTIGRPLARAAGARRRPHALSADEQAVVKLLSSRRLRKTA